MNEAETAKVEAMGAALLRISEHCDVLMAMYSTAVSCVALAIDALTSMPCICGVDKCDRCLGIEGITAMLTEWSP